MVKGTIACFMTCGYTEAGALQEFLHKINPQYAYKQCLPNKTRKRKGQPKMIARDSCGLTGEALLERVECMLRSSREMYADYSAIIFEDDCDGRFREKDEQFIKNTYEEIQNRIHTALGRDIPVLVLFASPEIESWFIADWDRGFGATYTNPGFTPDLSPSLRNHFCIHFRRYIETEVLSTALAEIEHYYNVGAEYAKLSDRIAKFFSSGMSEYFTSSSNARPDFIRRIIDSPSLFYSKKTHGDYMLRNLEPKTLAAVCKYFMQPFYVQLIDL